MSVTFYVYILRCADGTYYVGATDDLQQRLAVHSSGKGPKHTAVRRPVELLYSESHKTQADAVRRERQIKRWSRAKKEALVRGDTNLLRDLSRSRGNRRQ